MRISESWKDYELIDCSCGERLERWGNITLIRPDPQVVWKTPKQSPLWAKADLANRAGAPPVGEGKRPLPALVIGRRAVGGVWRAA